MNCKFGTYSLIQPFNQSLGRFSLINTKHLLLASLLVWAMLTLISAPLHAAGPSLDRGRRPADTFSSCWTAHINRLWAMARTLD